MYLDWLSSGSNGIFGGSGFAGGIGFIGFFTGNSGLYFKESHEIELKNVKEYVSILIRDWI